MVEIIKTIIILAAAVYLGQVIRSFNYMSLAELGRRQKEDQLAQRVWRAQRFGARNTIFLWTLLSLVLSLLLIQVNSLKVALLFEIIFGTGAILAYMFFAFLMPKLGWPTNPLTLASQVAPAIAWLLSKFGPPKGSSLVLDNDLVGPKGASLIHSKADHIEQLQQQLKKQKDPKSRQQIQLVIRALTLSDQQVITVMTPKNKILTIEKGINLSASVLSKIHYHHRKGFNNLVVVDESRQFVGRILTDQIFDSNVNVATLTVKDLKFKELYYVKGESSLAAVLRAYLKTKQEFFLVIDDDQKVIGSINLDQAIRPLLAAISLRSKPKSSKKSDKNESTN